MWEPNKGEKMEAATVPKAAVNSWDLTKAIRRVKKATGAKSSTLTVLHHLLLESSETGDLTLTATDLDNAASVTMQGVTNGPWAALVPLSDLYDMARKMPKDTMLFLSAQDSDEKHAGPSLVAESANLTVTIPGLEISEFPDMWPDVDETEFTRLTYPELKRLEKHTRRFCSTEDSRPILNGILFEIEDGERTIVATNGHRLLRHTNREVGAPDASFIVPSEAIRVLYTAVNKGDDVSVRSSGDKHVVFESDDARLRARCIEGPFPNVNQVFPTTVAVSVEVPADDWRETIASILPLTSDQTHRVKLTIDDAATFTVDSMGVEAKADAPVDRADWNKHADRPFEVGFNAKYLGQVLDAVGGERLTLIFAGVERALTVQGEGDTDALLMPLRLLD